MMLGPNCKRVLPQAYRLTAVARRPCAPTAITATTSTTSTNGQSYFSTYIPPNNKNTTTSAPTPTTTLFRRWIRAAGYSDYDLTKRHDRWIHQAGEPAVEIMYVHPLSRLVLRYLQERCPEWQLQQRLTQLTIYRDGTIRLMTNDVEQGYAAIETTQHQQQSPITLWTSYEEDEKKHYLHYCRNDKSQNPQQPPMPSSPLDNKDPEQRTFDEPSSHNNDDDKASTTTNIISIVLQNDGDDDNIGTDDYNTNDDDAQERVHQAVRQLIRVIDSSSRSDSNNNNNMP